MSFQKTEEILKMTRGYPGLVLEMDLKYIFKIEAGKFLDTISLFRNIKRKAKNLVRRSLY